MNFKTAVSIQTDLSEVLASFQDVFNAVKASFACISPHIQATIHLRERPIDQGRLLRGRRADRTEGLDWPQL